MFRLILAAALLVPAFAMAQDDVSTTELTARTKCYAKEVERYYCPTSGGWWNGPFYDAGCSVQCQAGQRAVCQEAGCDSRGNGDPVASACYCR
jgi:hypothetical protein